MKNILLILTFFLTSCGGGSDSSSSGSQKSIDEIIIGKWILIYEGTLCELSFQFYEDKRFLYKSLDAVITADYEIIPTNSNKKRYELHIFNVADNSLVDCNGESEDDTGTDMTTYIEINKDALSLFGTVDSENPIQIMSRSE